MGILPIQETGNHINVKQITKKTHWSVKQPQLIGHLFEFDFKQLIRIVFCTEQVCIRLILL